MQELVDTVDNNVENLKNTKNCGGVVLLEIYQKVKEKPPSDIAGGGVIIFINIKHCAKSGFNEIMARLKI